MLTGTLKGEIRLAHHTKCEVSIAQLSIPLRFSTVLLAVANNAHASTPGLDAARSAARAPQARSRLVGLLVQIQFTTRCEPRLKFRSAT